jgi:hypothetical protein
MFCCRAERTIVSVLGRSTSGIPTMLKGNTEEAGLDFMIAKRAKCMLFLTRQLKRPTTSLAARLPTPQ